MRLVCKEDRPVSRLVILASPPEWEARRISSPEETDFELPVDSVESDLTLMSWNEPRPSVAGDEDSSEILVEPQALVLASWSCQRSHSVEDKGIQ